MAPSRSPASVQRTAHRTKRSTTPRAKGGFVTMTRAERNSTSRKSSAAILGRAGRDVGGDDRRRARGPQRLEERARSGGGLPDQGAGDEAPASGSCARTAATSAGVSVTASSSRRSCGRAPEGPPGRESSGSAPAPPAPPPDARRGGPRPGRRRSRYRRRQCASAGIGARQRRQDRRGMAGGCFNASVNARRSASARQSPARGARGIGVVVMRPGGPCARPPRRHPRTCYLWCYLAGPLSAGRPLDLPVTL